MESTKTLFTIAKSRAHNIWFVYWSQPLISCIQQQNGRRSDYMGHPAQYYHIINHFTALACCGFYHSFSFDQHNWLRIISMLYEMQECSNLQLKMRVFLRWLNQRINRCIILEHPPIYYPSVETPSHLISIKCWDPLYGCTPSYSTCILDSHCQIQIPIVLCTSIILRQVPIKL